jgi:Cell division septal protein
MFRNIFLTYLIFITTLCTAKNYEINVNFESGFEYKYQEEFVNQLQFLRSTREIEYLVSNQDWIKDYSLRYKPFRKEVFISIRNRLPIFVLNKEFFFDEELNKFNFDQSKKDLIMVQGPIDDLEEVLKLIEVVESNSLIQFKIESIDYSYVNGWDVKSNKALIRFGKDLSEKRLNNFKDTVNYLFEISRIPSIIDVRYKDGVALKYGK